MALFAKFRKRARPIEYGSRSERVIRNVLLVVFIGMICWGFWSNSGNYLQKFKAEARVSDEAELLGAGQKRAIAAILGRAEKNYGVQIYVKVSLVPIVQSDAVPDAILFGVSPGFKQCALLMPEAWRQGLGEDFLNRLGEEIMRPAFAQEAWAAGTVQVISLMEKRLEQLSKGNINSGPELFSQHGPPKAEAQPQP